MAALATATAATTMVVSSSAPPARAAAPRVSGAVVLDTNANGTADVGASVGTNEPGFGAATVAVVCVGGTNDGAVLAATTPAANGSYAIEDIVLADGNGNPRCASGQAAVRVSVSDDHYSITTGPGADNDTPRTADPQVGRSTPFALNAATDRSVISLVRPDWTLDLGIPVDGNTGLPAVYTGSAPFDTSDPGCPAAPDDGHDCAAQDLVVRNQDTVTFTYAVTASSLDNLTPTMGDVVLEQTLDLDPDGPGGNPPSVANFARVPARCKPSGGGGTPPPTSEVVAQPSGAVVPEGAMPPAGTTSVTLRCNLGVWSQTGDALTLQPVVKISGASPNGAQFSSDARVYAVDDASVPIAAPDNDTAYGPIDITAAPAYELEKRGFFNQDPVTVDIGNGPEAGYVTYAVIEMKTNRRAGVEALQQPITVNEDLFGFLQDGTTAYPGMRYAILQCIPNPSGWGGTVGGRTAPYGDFTDVRTTVVDSGNCAVARNAPNQTSDYTLTLSGIDMSGSRYPTQTLGGGDLSAGPFYVASYRVQIFIPYETLDATDGTVGDNRGGLALYNRVGGFDPNGISGTSNFGAGVEPGYCDPGSVDGQNLGAPGMPHCAQLPSGARSDNVIGPTTFVFAPGYFAKYLLNQTTLYNGNWQRLPNMAQPHDGAGTLQPGQIVDTHMNWRNDGVTAGWTNSRMCDVFDNTMLRLVPSSATVTNGTAGIYAWLSSTGPGTGDYDPTLAAAYNAKWIFEFGHIDIDYDTDGAGPDTGDDPLGNGSLSSVSGRYDGTWSSQASMRCDDAAASGGWFTDPAGVPGGIDAVNAVRVRPGIDPATGQPTVQTFTVLNRLNFGMQVRDTFSGGPHAGTQIPAGAVAANFGSARADQDNGGRWLGRSYVPSPESTAVDGDRVTVARAQLAIQKRTITTADGAGDGAADFGQTGSAVAGNPIVWEVVAAVTAESAEPAPVSNLRITDVLPQYAEYDPDCTAAITGGTPADIVQPDTPSAGRTTLIWTIASFTPNTTLAPRRICTNSDPLAPNGTSLVNHSEITYAGSPVTPFDDHTVVLDQTGEIKLRKTVDAALDPLDDAQVYRLSAQNFSDTLTIGAPTIIEVFPYNGDGVTPGGVNRNPPSNFVGALALAGAPTVTNIGGGAYAGQFLYTADAPGTVNQNLNLNTSTWCSSAGGTFTLVSGVGPCPTSFADVTAIKFIGADNLTPFTSAATSGLTITFTLQAGDATDPFSVDANEPGDVYADRFTLFSSTFTNAQGFQTLASNRTVVRTVSHSVGDWIFEDRDGDGRYTAGRDLPAPASTVNLWYVPATGAPVLVATTTSAGGRYLFSRLPAGRYYVEIPATQFASGGPLFGFTVSPAPAAALVDQNDDVSQDALVGSGGAVVSTTFTLSATKNPTTGALTGDEPTGENLHGTVDPTTTDPFSNLAIDLALARPPAIDIEKEVCTLPDGACDPAAALGAGGWSTDGVPGNGPDSEIASRPYGNEAVWRITVTNTGDQYLGLVSVTDAAVAACGRATADVPAFADLAPDAVVRFICTSPGLTADIRPNTAVVRATPPAGQPPVTDTDTANVAVTSTLTLRKVIVDPAPDDDDGDAATFPVSVSCVAPAGGAPTRHDVALPRDGTDVDISAIPVGSVCTIAETDTDGGVATFSPSDTVTVDDPAAAEVTITNTYTAMTITKTVAGAPVDNGDGTATVAYDIVATNTGAVATTYSLHDQLQYGAGLTVVSAGVVSSTAGVTANPGWNGSTDTVVVAGQGIAAGAGHTFRVTVVARPGTAYGGTSADCTLQAGETGTGALNAASLTFAGSSSTAQACAELPTNVIAEVPPSSTLPTPPTVPPDDTLPVTGANGQAPTQLAAVAVLAGGLLLLAVRRRRRPS